MNLTILRTAASDAVKRGATNVYLTTPINQSWPGGGGFPRGKLLNHNERQGVRVFLVRTDKLVAWLSKQEPEPIESLLQTDLANKEE